MPVSGGVLSRPGVRGDDGARRDEVGANVCTGGDAFEAERDGWVDADGFFDDGGKVREFGGCVACDFAA